MTSNIFLAKKHIFAVLEKYAGTEQNLVVALSGGADSLFMMVLASEWCKTKCKDLYAVTVDHALREESYAEALNVGKIAEKYCTSHIIKKWEHGNIPAGQIEEMARKARYELLADACKTLKSKILLVGHNLDEQIETYLIRKEKKSDFSGLACMSEARNISDEIQVIRPCLPFTKQFIKSHLNSIGETWIEDPMNSNDDFLRVRKRKFICSLSYAQKQAMFDEIRLRGVERNSIETNAVEFLKNYSKIHEYGFVDLNNDTFNELDENIKCEILKRCIKLVGRQEYKKSSNQCKTVLSALYQNKSINIGKCIVKSIKNKIRIFRENRNLDLIKISSKSGIWDNRFRFEVFDEQILSNNSYIKHFDKCVVLSDDIPSYITVTLPSLWIDKKMVYLYNISKYSWLVDFQFVQDVDFLSIFSCVEYDGGIL